MTREETKQAKPPHVSVIETTSGSLIPGWEIGMALVMVLLFLWAMARDIAKEKERNITREVRVLPVEDSQ